VHGQHGMAACLARVVRAIDAHVSSTVRCNAHAHAS
jgi:hypothetical protein